jgi:hypothetical protein
LTTGPTGAAHAKHSCYHRAPCRGTRVRLGNRPAAQAASPSARRRAPNPAP